MNQFKTVSLLALLSALLIGASYSIIGGWGGVTIGVILATVTNFASWYYSDKIALAAFQAQPVTASQAPQLYHLVERLTQRGGLPMPGVYVVPSQAANAFATGRDPEHAAVAVTEGLLQMLPEDELEAVIAHELSHVAHRDTLTQAVAATIAGAIAFLAQMASYSFWFIGGSRDDREGNIFGALLMIIVAPIAATVIQLAISRTREFEADAGAARLTGNPQALANALRRLENLGHQKPMQGNPAFQPLLISSNFSGNFLGKLFSTHPSTEARIDNLMKVEQELLRG